ncbi:MAG TPA: hypothetical protein VFG83_03360 [Kofleriaceae bacterium]|nr:hypothetical protein [Kofleriaceae bacterium]
MAGDRLEMLLAQNVVTGIDFVHVDTTQTQLDVYFHVNPTTLAPPWTAAVDPTSVHISSLSTKATRPQVVVATTTWLTIDGRRVLRVETTSPGDFSRYALVIDSARIDRRFNDVAFSFKANCPSDLDCKVPPHACPPEAGVDYPVDYLARDFGSFRGALLDFAANRYPEWKDRLEADVGIMLAEVMAAVGDDMAYYQDRVARQAFLGTATERRSVRRIARLVDYEIDDGAAASCWLDVTVAGGAIAFIEAGTDVWAESDAGGRIFFEVGNGLTDVLASPPVTFQVRGDWNALAPHIWDEDETCLGYGATELWIRGHHQASLFPVGGASARWLLLRTFPTDASKPARNHMVWVRTTDVLEDRDQVFGQDVTKLAWDAVYATPFELDLEVLEVHANLVPTTAGVTKTARFSIGDASATDDAPAAIERDGAGGMITYRHTLADTDKLGLCWVKGDGKLVPEVRLFELVDSGGGGLVHGTEWLWRRAFVGVASSDSEDRHFSLEDGTWEVVRTWDRLAGRITHTDYRSGKGFTIRFGDGQLGRIPSAGTRFEVSWRIGNGAGGNVAADTLTHTELSDPASPRFTPAILAVTNPIVASTGRDPETEDHAVRLAPEAYRAVTYRAVRPEDYAEATERLEPIQRAGAELRFTGSWQTLFCTPDPKASSTLSETLREDVQDQLDRFRQAGRDAHVLDPVYAFIDLELTICIQPWAYPGEVKAEVVRRLVGEGHPWSAPGFFHPDHFTFGTPLNRSQLEATVQSVSGVRAIKLLNIRRRGHFAWRELSDPFYAPATNEVIGLENDPLYPERGSLRVVTEGGA